MSWYLLPSTHQKQVGAVMHFMQNGTVLTIGPFADLDFETLSIVNVCFCIHRISQFLNVNSFPVDETNFSFHNVAIQSGQLENRFNDYCSGYFGKHINARFQTDGYSRWWEMTAAVFITMTIGNHHENFSFKNQTWRKSMFDIIPYSLSLNKRHLDIIPIDYVLKKYVQKISGALYRKPTPNLSNTFKAWIHKSNFRTYQPSERVSHL